MNFALHPELLRFVQEKVAAGTFESADQVVNEAVRLMKQQEELTPDDVAELRALVRVGVDQSDRGLIGPWDPHRVKSRVRGRPTPRES